MGNQLNLSLYQNQHGLLIFCRVSLGMLLLFCLGETGRMSTLSAAENADKIDVSGAKPPNCRKCEQGVGALPQMSWPGVYL